MMNPRVLVVAATPMELGADAAWDTLVCGVGPVDAAVRTAAAIAAQRPDAILHVGIAGARRAAALAPATIVIGEASHYVDLTIPEHFAPRVTLPDDVLLRAVQRALPHARTMPIGTSARVGGTFDGNERTVVEAMEGFAVLRTAQLAGIPAVEVRAISNEIEESDRARWCFAQAFDTIIDVTPMLVQAIVRALQPPVEHVAHQDGVHA